MKVIVEIRNTKGRNLAYPICEKAKLFAELINRTTLNRKAIKVIKELGYDIIINN